MYYSYREGSHGTHQKGSSGNHRLKNDLGKDTLVPREGIDFRIVFLHLFFSFLFAGCSTVCRATKTNFFAKLYHYNIALGSLGVCKTYNPLAPATMIVAKKLENYVPFLFIFPCDFATFIATFSTFNSHI